ncbi:Pex12 amino terminal region-domain-containing protein [Rhypophila decipiens]|uniref:Pex12 amino terminal region-domain-containing protein n=1 Tax=Rhypophila decipiens TaxID=261697 RepID=A0AAN6YFB2_9PEZI|nr:Pex12 amino terminal region-domain-containing protein [Rhypophila decipiens]
MTDSKPKDGGGPVTSVANGAADSFQAAQTRLLLRRQQREQAESARLALQTSESTLRNRISQTQSPLLRRLGSSTLSLWDTISSREGTRPSFRVGQVDAELLDQELVDLLKTQVGDALKYFSSTGVPGQTNSSIKDEWDAEILLVLRAVLFKLTVWDHDATYGAALQNLKYTDARKSGAVLTPPSKWQKSLYGLVTVGGRYIWTKWEDWLVDHNNPDPLSFDDEEGESSARVQRLSRITSTLSTVHAAAEFVSFLVFLLHGRYRTLLDRILRMRLAPPTSQVSREVSFEYLNRQLVWHAFTEFLLFVLPLIGINRWRRWLARTWKKTKGIFTASTAGANAEEGEEEKKKGELAFLPERTCAICYADQNSATTENEVLAAGAGQAAKGTVGSAQTDVTNPYEGMPCGCVYCFVCLATRIEREEGEGWVCLRCGELVKECKPWGGDVLPPVGKSPGLKTVVFADDVVGGLAESDAGEEVEVHQEEEEEAEERQVEDEEEEVEGSAAGGEGSDYHTDTGSNSGSDAGYEMDEEEVGEDMD